MVDPRTETEKLELSSFHAYNIGHLSSRASRPLFAPCTPSAVIKLLEFTGVEIAGANAVVLGRSDIVGNPVSSMLKNKDATVTQCHSKTRNMEQIVRIIYAVIQSSMNHNFVCRSGTLTSSSRPSASQNLSRVHGSNQEQSSSTSGSTTFRTNPRNQVNEWLGM